MGNINNQYFQNSNGGGRGRRERGECCTHTRFPSSPKTGKRGNPIPQTVLVLGGNDGRRVDDSFRKLIDCLSLLRRRLLGNGGRCPPPSFVPRTRFPSPQKGKKKIFHHAIATRNLWVSRAAKTKEECRPNGDTKNGFRSFPRIK